MIKAIIIDDEPLARMIVQEYLQSYSQNLRGTGMRRWVRRIKAIQQHHPELIFLDIQMPKINGFEMLELVEDFPPAVIFTTAFDEYAIRAFENHAVDYLLKPFNKQRFDKAVRKWLDQYTAAAQAAAGTPAAGPASTPEEGPTVATGNKTRELLDHRRSFTLAAAACGGQGQVGRSRSSPWKISITWKPPTTMSRSIRTMGPF